MDADIKRRPVNELIWVSKSSSNQGKQEITKTKEQIQVKGKHQVYFFWLKKEHTFFFFFNKEPLNKICKISFYLIKCT